MNILLQPGFCSIFNVKGVSFEELLNGKPVIYLICWDVLQLCSSSNSWITSIITGFAEHDVWFSE